MDANFFQLIGQKIRLKASGRISTLVTSPGTLTLQFRIGSISVFDSAAMTLNIVAQTNTHWRLDIDLILRVVGSSAQFFGDGSFRSHAVIGSPAPTAGGCGEHLLPYNTAPALGTAFDAKTAANADLFATWSVNSASNSITCHNFELLSCL